MQWIFLSPHLDDAVLSCGGLIVERLRSGDRAAIWTVFAGDPPPGELSPFASSLHQRWQTGLNAVAARREEDRAACRRLGAAPRHFDLPDCIYRTDSTTGVPLIAARDDLFQPLPPSQLVVANQVQELLAQTLDAEARLVCPLALGSHIDHQIVRLAAERLHLPLWYYADYPYAVQENQAEAGAESPDWQVLQQPVSAASLKIWQAAVAEYRSQISTFWGPRAEMEQAIRDWWSAGGGCKLWLNERQDS